MAQGVSGFGHSGAGVRPRGVAGNGRRVQGGRRHSGGRMPEGTGRAWRTPAPAIRQREAMEGRLRWRRVRAWARPGSGVHDRGASDARAWPPGACGEVTARGGRSGGVWEATYVDRITGERSKDGRGLTGACSCAKVGSGRGRGCVSGDEDVGRRRRGRGLRRASRDGEEGARRRRRWAPASGARR